MTKYYFAKTNADNEVIATDGKVYFVLPSNSRGTDEMTGIDLYAENTVDELAHAFQTVATCGVLYNIDDIKREFIDDVYDFTADEEHFEELVELVAIA